MSLAQENFTATTIYFDGQFWCALIEQCAGGRLYAGRYVFGAEPTNPETLKWTAERFAAVPLLQVESRAKIKLKKLARTGQKTGSGIPESLAAFSAAQKEYAKERKALSRKKRKIAEKEKYLLKKIKRKERK